MSKPFQQLTNLATKYAFLISTFNLFTTRFLPPDPSAFRCQISLPRGGREPASRISPFLPVGREMKLPEPHSNHFPCSALNCGQFCSSPTPAVNTGAAGARKLSHRGDVPCCFLVRIPLLIHPKIRFIYWQSDETRHSF